MMQSILGPLWAYRGFVLGNVKREFQTKYRNSILGVAWTILNPLAMILVYTVVFSQVMHAKLPSVTNTFGYSIYLCIGIITWGLFTEIVTRSQTMFLDNANLLKKISFPRICVPVTVVLSALLNFGIIFGLFTLFLLISGSFPGMAYFALVPLIALMVAFAMALGLVLGVLNVFFRDIGHFFGIFITFWFWLTPIVYPASILPGWALPYAILNPMFNFMTAAQNVVVRGEWPQWMSLWPIVLCTLLLAVLGLRLFRRHAGEIVDEL